MPLTEVAAVPAPEWAIDTLSARRAGETKAARQGAGVVSSAHGQIEAILFAVPPRTGWEEGEQLEERHFNSLIAALETSAPAQRTYVILHHTDRSELVESWRQSHDIDPERWQTVTTPLRYEIWAQDPYVALQGRRGTPILCEGVLYDRGGMVIADEVVAGLRQSRSALGLEAIQAFLFFEGGNVLGTPEWVLLGADHFWRNYLRPGLTDPDEIFRRFEVLLAGSDRGLLLPGLEEGIPADRAWGEVTGFSQPIFHIDMHVTPTGVIGNDGREILFYGKPARARELLGEQQLPFEDGLDDEFDAVEKELNAYFDVRPLPLLPIRSGVPAFGWEERKYYLTWNNAVIENNGAGARRVFMPTYGGAAADLGLDPDIRRQLDEEAAAAWIGIGFEVHRLSSMEDLAYGGGAIHCITKTLKRGR